MPVPPPGHSSSIGSTSSHGSSKSSLLAFPVDPVSSQSDITDLNPPLMPPRGDSSAYALAASPSQAAYRANNPASASQKFKRAFAKRRKPSQDASSLLVSGDNRSTSDATPGASSSHASLQPGAIQPSSSRPSTSKLTIHLFGGRKESQAPAEQPPPLPPKPAMMRSPAPLALHTSAGISSTRPRNSIMLTSPSINPAIEFMREDYARQCTQHSPELEQNKEDWRKSDSTVASGHTLKPSRTPDTSPSTAAKRRSTFSTSNNAADPSLDLPSNSQASDIRNSPGGSLVSKQAKQRSLSLNADATSKQSTPGSTDTVISAHAFPSSIRSPGSTAPSSHSPHSPSPSHGPLGGTHSASHSVSLSPASHDIPTLTRTAANGIIGSGIPSASPANKTKIRGRLAAWAATTSPGSRTVSPFDAPSMSSPSLSNQSGSSAHQSTYVRTPVSSTASQTSAELQAIAAVRHIQDRTRSPSTGSAGTAGIRLAATSLTSGASAMALGLGKRAYEKVGRVWAGGVSGSGSGSDTAGHHSGPAVPSKGEDLLHAPHYGPSAFAMHGRRTQNAPSGTWSISSLSGGSRSSSEREFAGGRNTPPSGLGRLVRPPRSIGSGAVFGRELWECVQETRASVPANYPLAERMIPALVLRCAQHLHKWGIQEEGLFRISGRSSHINRLRHEFDSGADYDIIDCSPSELDPHAVSSVFKAYLRELPEPILTRALIPLFDNAMNAESSRISPTNPTFMTKSVGGGGPTLPSSPKGLPVVRKPPSLSTFTLPTSTSLRPPSTTLVEALGNLVSRLPRENRDVLLTVVELMRATAAQSKDTKMPLSNLLLVFCPSLGMGPTLLRVLCDSPRVWARQHEPRLQDVDKPPAMKPEEDSDYSDSDSVSSYGDVQVVSLPPMDRSVEGETPDDNRMQFDTTSHGATSVENIYSAPRAGSPLSAPLARPRAHRRVPVPAILLDGSHPPRIPPFCRSFTPPPITERLLQSTSLSASASASTPTLHVQTRCVEPQSAVPVPGFEPMVSPPRGRQFSSPLPSSSGYTSPSVGTLDHNKELPASPRSLSHTDLPVFPRSPSHKNVPASPPSPSHKDLPAFPQSPARKHFPESPLSLSHPEVEDRASSTPAVHMTADAIRERRSPRIPPLIPSSRSAPSVVFPSPKTPTIPSPKKHAVSSSVGRQFKLSSDDGDLSPSKRPIRRPSLNMLFNVKRNGPPSPQPRTPTISSPLSIFAPIAKPTSVESSPRTITTPFPPVLSLPLDASVDSGLGLGWDDMFGNSANEISPIIPRESAESSQPVPPLSTAVSQPSSPPQPMQTPPSTSRRPTTEFLLSSDGFFSVNGPPLALPSPTSVLEAASLSTGVHDTSPRDSEPDPASLQEDSSSGTDTPEVDSPVKELFAPHPRLSFQLRRSSMEEEDWASAVLLAAGKPVNPPHE